VHSLIRPERFTAEQVALSRYVLPKDGNTTDWLRETRGISGELYGLEADAFPRTSSGRRSSRRRLRTSRVPPAGRAVAGGRGGAARRAGAGKRCWRSRATCWPWLVPSEQAPAPGVAEHLMQMDAAELNELVGRLRKRLTPASTEG
jgi:hypothetical protein